jgi:O-Antigen ligase
MLADHGTATVQLSERPGAGSQPESARHRRTRNLGRAIAFLIAATVVLVYSLRGSGSYDVITFEEQGLVIWWVLALGLALGLLPRRRPSTATLLLFAALAAYTAWTALSLLWTNSSELTTVETARSLDYLGLVVLASLALNRNTWRAAAAGLGAGALAVCVLAVGTRLDPAVFGTDHVAVALGVDRLSYPFGYWNAVGAWGAMCTVLALAWSAHSQSLTGRALALALVPVATTMTYLSYSRAGVAGSALALLAGLALSRNRITLAVHAAAAAAGAALVVSAVRGAPEIAKATGTKGAGGVLAALVFAAGLGAAVAVATRLLRVDRRRLPPAVRRPLGVAAAIAVLGAGGVFGPHLANNAWHSFTNTTPPNTANPSARLTTLAGTRYAIWKSAIKAFDAHPAEGTGAGTFQFWWNQHGTTSEFVLDAHNIWLQNMAELGLPGLLLIVAVMAAALGVGAQARMQARRPRSAGAAAAFVGVMIVYLLHASVDWMWESTAVTVLALAGIATLSARLSRTRLRLALPARVPLVAVAAVAAVVQLPGILSTSDINRSQAAERAGQSSTALVLARDAASAEPWSASAHEQEALLLEADGRLGQALREENIALSDEPGNYVHWLIRSRMETELGRLRAALRDYRRAYALRPYASVFALVQDVGLIQR